MSLTFLSGLCGFKEMVNATQGVQPVVQRSKSGREEMGSEPDVDSAKLYLRQIGLELVFLRALVVGFILYLF